MSRPHPAHETLTSPRSPRLPLHLNIYVYIDFMFYCVTFVVSSTFQRLNCTFYKSSALYFWHLQKWNYTDVSDTFFFANTLSYHKPGPEAFSLTIFKHFSLFQWPTKHQKKYSTSVSSIPFDWRLKNSSRRWRRICGNLLVFLLRYSRLLVPHVMLSHVAALGLSWLAQR